MSEQWLKCVVFKGMFSDELAVEVKEKAGGPISFFVPKDKVRCTSGKDVSSVKVRVIWREGTAWAILPSPEGTLVPVNDSDLAVA